MKCPISSSQQCGSAGSRLFRNQTGGVRGIVVGDALRRLVARTMAQQIAEKVEKATSPHQYALKTKVGSECVAHILQTLTDADSEATVVSIDGRIALLMGVVSCCHSSALSMASRPHSCGKMRLERCGHIPQGEGGRARRPSDAPSLLLGPTCCS